uniref:Uncharacterized protein n=1 Tax=viral metagenome TaxID=1070528 RepID=A0A6M3LFH5_9ZZZZ
MSDLKPQRRQVLLTPSEALRVILDCVDYQNGACGLTEMVGAVLPVLVLDLAHRALREEKKGGQ